MSNMDTVDCIVDLADFDVEKASFSTPEKKDDRITSSPQYETGGVDKNGNPIKKNFYLSISGNTLFNITSFSSKKDDEKKEDKKEALKYFINIKLKDEGSNVNNQDAISKIEEFDEKNVKFGLENHKFIKSDFNFTKKDKKTGKTVDKSEEEKLGIIEVCYTTTLKTFTDKDGNEITYVRGKVPIYPDGNINRRRLKIYTEDSDDPVEVKSIEDVQKLIRSDTPVDAIFELSPYFLPIGKFGYSFTLRTVLVKKRAVKSGSVMQGNPFKNKTQSENTDNSAGDSVEEEQENTDVASVEDSDVVEAKEETVEDSDAEEENSAEEEEDEEEEDEPAPPPKKTVSRKKVTSRK